jgi:hypothetical protein
MRGRRHLACASIKTHRESEQNPLGAGVRRRIAGRARGLSHCVSHARCVWPESFSRIDSNRVSRDAICVRALGLQASGIALCAARGARGDRGRTFLFKPHVAAAAAGAIQHLSCSKGCGWGGWRSDGIAAESTIDRGGFRPFPRVKSKGTGKSACATQRQGNYSPGGETGGISARVPFPAMAAMIWRPWKRPFSMKISDVNFPPTITPAR